MRDREATSKAAHDDHAVELDIEVGAGNEAAHHDRGPAPPCGLEPGWRQNLGVVPQIKPVAFDFHDFRLSSR
jgi:hypothetical protein